MLVLQWEMCANCVVFYWDWIDLPALVLDGQFFGHFFVDWFFFGLFIYLY